MESPPVAPAHTAAAVMGRGLDLSPQTENVVSTAVTIASRADLAFAAGSGGWTVATAVKEAATVRVIYISFMTRALSDVR